MYPTPCDTTLGKYLAGLRKRKGIAQKQLARLLGLKGTAPIVAIEKDRRHPTVKTIEQWISAVDASPVERHLALGKAGYIPNTQLASLDEIIRVINPIAEQLRRSSYPSYIIDFRQNLWAINSVTKAVIGNAEVSALLRMRANLFDCLFNSRLGIRTPQRNILQVETDQIQRVKALNVFRQHEPFYCAYPEYMRGRLELPDEDYDRFARAWRDTPPEPDMEALSLSRLVWNMETPEGQIIYFEVIPEVILGLNNLFFIATHQPYDHPEHPQNQALAEQYLQHFRTGEAPCYRLWDLVDRTLLPA